ncbi:hypothetical protein Vadar_029481 [Vaccinium darrowii]|nr:hypothetical protein Vadar_029481 [Vaccinium darrowii]
MAKLLTFDIDKEELPSRAAQIKPSTLGLINGVAKPKKPAEPTKPTQPSGGDVGNVHGTPTTNGDLEQDIARNASAKSRTSESAPETEESRRAGDEGSGNQGSQNERPPRKSLEHPENNQDPLAALQAQIDGLAKQFKGKAPTTVEELVQNTDSPFTAEVRREPLPRKFMMPQIDTFNNSTDSLDHLKRYKNLMMLHAVLDEVMCRAFPTTLKGSAQMWFNKIKPNTIGSFKQLSENFVSYSSLDRTTASPRPIVHSQAGEQ